MTLKKCESPTKRHSWTWSGCGHTVGFGVVESVSGDLLEGTESPQKSNTIEVLKKDGRNGGHEMLMIMGRTQMERYSPEQSMTSNGHIRYDLSGQDLVKETKIDADLATPECLTQTFDCVTEEEEEEGLMNNGLIIQARSTTLTKVHTKHKNETHSRSGPKNKEINKEIVKTLLFIALLIGESASWMTIYTDMKQKEKTRILLFLLLPTFVTSIIWFAMNWFDKHISMKSFCLIAFLLPLSIPSPIFM